MKTLFGIVGLIALMVQIVPSAIALESALQPWPQNPWYWSYSGKPILLLGASDDDNLFQWTDDKLIPHLDRMASAGGNVVRNTMSDRHDRDEVYPFKQLNNGKYDLNLWNVEYWERFERMLRETSNRDIFVQIEIWDRFDYTDSGGRDHWQCHPYNPKNNLNYTYEESGFTECYPDHPGTNRQPFFFTTPQQLNNKIVLSFQKRFVEKLLEHSLRYDHVLYCMDNETSGEEKWGRYWAGFIKERAQKEGKQVFTTEMWDDWNLRSGQHKRTFNHREIYDFADVSQNNHNTGDKHWDNFLHVREYLAPHPCPMNTTKTYGSDADSRFGTGRDALERFWRHLLAGAATMRFHRPPTGLGLNNKTTATLRAARVLESFIPLWSVNAANELLSDREPNEAYLAADPSCAWALYFPDGGEVRLDLSAARGPLIAHWINIETGELDAEQSFEPADSVIFKAPTQGHWAAAIVPVVVK